MQWQKWFLFGFILVVWSPPSVHAFDSVIGEKDLPKATKQESSVKSADKPVNTASSSTPVPTEKSEKKEEKTVGYDKGFFIRTADGKYKLVISGYIQFDTEYLRVAGENEAGFRVRRARLIFAGNLFNPRFTYKFQIDLVKFKNELLLDAYVNYDILKTPGYMEVRAGQQTIPYIRQHQVSSSEQEFIERSIASNEFLPADDQDTDGDGVADKLVRNGRDVGIQLHGKPFNKKMEYQVGIFNGHGTNTLNLNTDFLYMGRFVYNIMGDPGYSYEGDWDIREDPAMALGASANYNVRSISNDKVTSTGGEGVLKWKGFAATGEFFYRNTKSGDTLLGTQNDYGYYAQLGYFFIPKRFEVGTRASQVFLAGPQNDMGEFQMVLNGFLYGRNLKVQTDYSYLPTNTKNGVENNQRWRLRLQTKF
jgi:hypothetical protein